MQFEKLHTKRWVELPPLKSTSVLVKATFWLRSDLPCQGQSTRREETAALSGFDSGGTSPPPRLWEEAITNTCVSGCLQIPKPAKAARYQQGCVLSRTPASVQECVDDIHAKVRCLRGGSFEVFKGKHGHTSPLSLNESKLRVKEGAVSLEAGCSWHLAHGGHLSLRISEPRPTCDSRSSPSLSRRRLHMVWRLPSPGLSGARRPLHSRTVGPLTSGPQPHWVGHSCNTPAHSKSCSLWDPSTPSRGRYLEGIASASRLSSSLRRPLSFGQCKP